MTDECETFLQIGDEKQWMLKPEEGSQKKGMTLNSGVESAQRELQSKAESEVSFFPYRDQFEIPAKRRFFVQEYISKPLLLKGCKFG